MHVICMCIFHVEKLTFIKKKKKKEFKEFTKANNCNGKHGQTDNRAIRQTDREIKIVKGRETVA